MFTIHNISMRNRYSVCVYTMRVIKYQLSDAKIINNIFIMLVRNNNNNNDNNNNINSNNNYNNNNNKIIK